MVTKISMAAGDIWVELDKNEGVFKRLLFERLQSQGHSREVLCMALGWLLYQKHVKWTPGEHGGRFFRVTSAGKEDHCHESSSQNGIAAHSA